MRRLLVATAAALLLAAASFVVAGRAEAMPLSGAAGLKVAAKGDLVEKVRTVCRPVWNGWRWVQSCYWVPGPYVYGGPYGYYGPPRPHFYRPYRHWRRY